MKQDQNRIELRLNTAEYDECVLYANQGTRVLPGSLVVFVDGVVLDTADPIRPNRGFANFSYSAPAVVKVTESVGPEGENANHYIDNDAPVSLRNNYYSPYARFAFKAYYSTDPSDIREAYGNDAPTTVSKEFSPNRFPVAVVLENALFGKALNHEAVVGDLQPVRYLTSSNEVLLRAVPGAYSYGDAVYAVQTESNGIWVCSSLTLDSGKASGILPQNASLGMKIGICQETYTVTPEMCEIVDDSEPNVPSTGFFSGIKVNLIKVRTAAFFSVTTPLPPIEGVSVTAATGLVYNGSAQSVDSLVTISGTQDGDTVTKIIENSPEVKRAGTYKIIVSVQRNGYTTFNQRVEVTIAPKQLTISGVLWERLEDGTTTPIVKVLDASSVIGIVGGDGVSVTGTTSNFPSSEPGEYQLTASFTVGGIDGANYFINDTTVAAEITALPPPIVEDPEIEGITIQTSSPVYDGDFHDVSTLLTVAGTEQDDVVSFSPSAIKNAGPYDITVTIQREGYKTYTETISLTVAKRHLTVTGTTVADKTIDQTTDADITIGTVVGIANGDLFNVTASGSFPSSAVGTYSVVVNYSIPTEFQNNYIAPVSDTVTASIRDTFTYEVTANGSETETTTYLDITLSGLELPQNVSTNDITIGGDAVINTPDAQIAVSGGGFRIPVRMVQNSTGVYSVSIAINAGNSDVQTKTVPAHFVSCYWGIFPWQILEDSPSESDILGMSGLNTISGNPVSEVTCTFALNETDWNNAAARAGLTGEDADFNESGSGLEFFVTSWPVQVTNIMNETRTIPQMSAFEPFSVLINGTEYVGVISVIEQAPSGTSPFYFTLG